MTIDVVLRAAVVLGLILTVAGVGIVYIVHRSGTPIAESVLAHRWMTWAVLAPLWLAAAVWTPARILLLVTFAVVAVIEFTRLRPSLVRADRWLLLGWAVLAVPAAIVIDIDYAAVIVVAGLSTIVLPLLSADTHNGPKRVGDQCSTFMLIILPIALLGSISASTSPGVFFAVGLAVALSDVGAFIIGSRYGHRRFAPMISPSKTVEGVLGNVVGATIGIGLAGAIGAIPWSLVWLAPLVACGAVVGDLSISLVKRSQNTKDAGTWLPGFGGLLDRVDSLLVVAPVVFVVMSWIPA